MKRKFYTGPALALAALAGSAALLLGACTATDSAGNTSAANVASKSGNKPSASPPPQAADAHADGIRRMGPAELQKLVEGGKVVIYDTRSKMSYDQEHIKGALSMPHEEADRRAAEFPRDKTLVFYCTWPAEHTSAGAALTLKSKGIQDTAALLGGMTAWKNAGLPTEGSTVQK